MPPKAKPATSKKADQKKKEKVIEDKTFGIKNKKGAKQQRFIQQVEKQVKSSGVHPRKLGAEDPLKKKDEKLKEAKELSMIFKPVQKVEKGVDPKSVLCSFFKFGQCTKGNKCKFSHDLAVERKAEKRSLYSDVRDDEGETMENWTEDKLKEVVEKKHGEDEKKKPTTDIICKYFIDAVERSKYGWFWSCPNGTDCIYRHALPPGFVLQKDRKKEEKVETTSLIETLELERLALTGAGTKLTLETFLQWKKRKMKEKQETEMKAQDKKRLDFKAGHHVGLSGRDMFSFNPELAANDLYEEGDEAFDNYERSEEDGDEIQYRDLDMNYLTTYEDIESSNNESVAAVDPNEIALGALNEDLFLEDIDDKTLSNELNKCKITNGEQ